MNAYHKFTFFVNGCPSGKHPIVLGLAQKRDQRPHAVYFGPAGGKKQTRLESRTERDGDGTYIIRFDAEAEVPLDHGAMSPLAAHKALVETCRQIAEALRGQPWAECVLGYYDADIDVCHGQSTLTVTPPVSGDFMTSRVNLGTQVPGDCIVSVRFQSFPPNPPSAP